MTEYNRYRIKGVTTNLHSCNTLYYKYVAMMIKNNNNKSKTTICYPKEHNYFPARCCVQLFSRVVLPHIAAVGTCAVPRHIQLPVRLTPPPLFSIGVSAFRCRLTPRRLSAHRAARQQSANTAEIKLSIHCVVQSQNILPNSAVTYTA